MFNSNFNFFWLVGVLCFFCCEGYSNTVKSCVETDKQALLKLCDLQHLIYLYLNDNRFEGSKIPECIGSLSQLRELSIVGTLIGGTIPRGLQNLSNLETLDLRYNDLIVNDLEWISHISSLRYLALSQLNLSQAVDWQSSLSKAPHLSEINLDNCALMSHVNPASFVHTNSSTSLQILVLSNNYLDSSILPWLSNISKVLTHLELYNITLEHIFPNALNINSLEVLNLGSNPLQLSPKAFSNMNSLQTLYLYENSLRHIPSYAFANMNSLPYLYLSQNSLRHIPSDAFTNTTFLKSLDLRENKLENSLLKSISNLCGLKGLWLSYNNFSCQLSDWILQLRCSQNHIEYLDLSHNPFCIGPFPNFSRLSEVVTLNLENTSLGGSIPQSFGHLPHLSQLYLSHNNLTGPLPLFVGLVSLTYLDLSNNRLNGNILPSAFRQVGNLVELRLSSNRLNSVINETHLSTLSNLRVLDVSQNLILFNFSSNWVTPFQLQVFSASSCNFGPDFPRWLKHQKELQTLDISNASISDSIPRWLWLNSFLYLNLSHNKLCGELTKSFLKVYFYSWDLSFNNLSGPIPNFPPNAGALLLSNNMFSGTISSICETFQPKLHYLDISNNFLSGRLPDCWGQLSFLYVLRLENNNFSGAIPNSIGTSLNNLRGIHLNNNNLSGNFPALMNSSQLLFIDFGQNNLNGMLPSLIGQYLHNLIGLDLKANKLQGRIPTNLCNLPFLQILDLSKNNITGNIPHCFGNLRAMSNMAPVSPAISYAVGGQSHASFLDTATLTWKGEYVEHNKILLLMKTIDLSCNHLTGEIPSSITKLVALPSLNLSRNNFKGSIPLNMGQMERLESLDLSKNSLSDKIPISFSNLSFLSFLNLSFNNLSRKIPTATQLQTFEASSYIGNQGLCGPPLTERCLGDGSSYQNSNPSNNDGDGDDKLISFGFYVSMVLGFIIGFWGVLGTLMLKKSWRHSFFHFFINMND